LIYLEEICDQIFELNKCDDPDHTSWEKKIGVLCEYGGNAVGSATASATATLVSPVVKIPDEIKEIIILVFELLARKSGEYVAHKYLTENPEYFEGNHYMKPSEKDNSSKDPQ